MLNNNNQNTPQPPTIFNYDGSTVRFVKGNNDFVYANATEMAKPFGKHPKHFLINSRTKAFLNSLGEVRNLTSTDLVVVIHGNDGGTWFHEDVAIEFARWLNPSFAVWCNDRIKELLKIGITTNLSVEEILNNPDLMISLLTNLKTERERSSMLAMDNVRKDEVIKILEPKADIFDQVLSSKSTFTVTVVAKELNMTAKQLNQELKDKKVQFNNNGVWVLHKEYQGMGYTAQDTVVYGGESKRSTKWTEKGRLFILSLYGLKVPASVTAPVVTVSTMPASGLPMMLPVSPVPMPGKPSGFGRSVTGFTTGIA